jgi:hypothetical protein
MKGTRLNKSLRRSDRLCTSPEKHPRPLQEQPRAVCSSVMDPPSPQPQMLLECDLHVRSGKSSHADAVDKTCALDGGEGGLASRPALSSPGVLLHETLAKLAAAAARIVSNRVVVGSVPEFLKLFDRSRGVSIEILTKEHAGQSKSSYKAHDHIWQEGERCEGHAPQQETQARTD